MTSPWEAWHRLLLVWLPTLLLCVISIGLYAWQSSDSITEQRLQGQVTELRDRLASLRATREAALAQHSGVCELRDRLEILYEKSFGTLDERLTAIMREVESTTRSSGLLPGAFSYAARQDEQVPFTRFSIDFGIQGQYSQVRQMLAGLQQSPELLIVDTLSLQGDRTDTTRELMVSIELATYLSRADRTLIERLNRGLTLDGGAQREEQQDEQIEQNAQNGANVQDEPFIEREGEEENEQEGGTDA